MSSIIYLIGFLVLSGIVLSAVHVHFGLFLLGCAITIFMSKRKGEKVSIGRVLFWGVLSAILMPLFFGLMKGLLSIGFVVLGFFAILALIRFLSSPNSGEKKI